jgi:hypothetical protein
MTPFLAILRHDLRTLTSSWLLRLWLAGTVVLTLLLAAGNWQRLPTSLLTATLQFPYLVFPWFLVVMALGVMPLSGARAEALADGILSRPVTRYEYLLAAWLARVVTVLAVYLVVMIPTLLLVMLVERKVPEDPVAFSGVVATMGLVGLVLVFQVTLAFLLGTVTRSPLVAIVVLLFLWYPVDALLDTVKLEELSPISLNRAIPTLLREPPEAADPEVPEALGGKEAAAHVLEAVEFIKGLSFEAEEPAEPTLPFFSHEFRDFSLLWVALGYGVPTLAAIALATVCFCVRDL